MRSRTAWAREALVLLLLLGIAFLVTWPLGKKLFSEFYVDSDPSATAWSLWWTKERLFSFHHPWSAPDLFAPQGTMLAFSAHFPLAGAVLSPLTALLGPPVTVNLTKLVLPVLLSYVCYRLALALGLSRTVALATGVLYGCSAQLVYRADVHFNFAVGALVPPLALLLFVRFHQTKKLRYAVLSGGALGAGMMLDPTSVVFAAIAGATYALGVALRSSRAELRPLGIGLLVVGASAFAFASPQLVAMKKQVDAGHFTTDTPTLAGSWVLYGNTVESLVGPSPSFRLVEPIRDVGDAARGRDEGFPKYGWGLLFLAGAGLALVIRRALVRWLGLLWLGATIMSLGPSLKVEDSTFIPLPIERYGYELSAVLPYTWYVQIPGFADQRVAGRFVILGVLAAAILAGFGIVELSRRGRWARGALALALIVAALDLGSPMSFQGPISQPELYDPIRRDRSRSLVVDVPLAWVTGTRFLGTPTNVRSMLRATEHEHPIAYGVVGRADAGMLADLAQHRFYTDLMLLQGGAYLTAAPVPSPPDPIAGRMDARVLGVGWVVIQPSADPAVFNYLRLTGFGLVNQQDGVSVYRASELRAAEATASR